MLEISLETNKKKNNEIDNEISAVIYETLGEVELEYRKYGEALNYLTKALDLRQKFKSNEDKHALKRIAFFINFIYDQYNYEEINAGTNHANRLNTRDRHKSPVSSLNQNSSNNVNLNNFNNPSLLLSNSNLNNNMLLKSKTFISNNNNNKNIESDKDQKNSINNNNQISDEEDNAFNYNFTNFLKSNMQNLSETYNNLSLKVKPKEIEKPEADMLNPNLPQSLRDEEIEEVEKFFLFMTKLNQEEIELLNKNQKFSEINLPINFSDAFKANLSYSQKIQLLEMKVLKLRRSVILKNPRGKIEVENLNFEILHMKNNSKKKIDNVLNRYANYRNLEKWVENNINYNNTINTVNDGNNNFNETSKNKNKNEYEQREEFNNKNNNHDEYSYNNIGEEKFNDSFNLNQSERMIFNEFKNSLIGFIRKNPNIGYEMLSEVDIVSIIKNSNEDEIKYWIKNPEKVLNNNDSNNEYLSEG